MAVTRAEQRTASRRALSTEGRRRFAADGHHDVVLAEVTRAVGVTKGAAHHHFESKAGLFRAVDEESSARHPSEAPEALVEAGIITGQPVEPPARLPPYPYPHSCRRQRTARGRLLRGGPSPCR